ncbi:NAD-dependent DNA ligase [Providencia alcalifaciens]|nr:NAD-dependent DNA ligase [Providencia alcalifaciens]
MSQTLLFIYVNSREIVSIQTINNVSENETYIQGISLNLDESGKLKTFRKDRIIEYVDSLEEAQSFIDGMIECGDFQIKEPKPETFDIHFTGFKKDDKSELEKLASDAGMEVRKSVTVHLKLLCYGYNASQMKMDKAREMGVIILNEQQFREFLKTGDFTDQR